MAKTKLPPGFRFHPTDVELVWYYLKRKLMGKPLRFEAIAEIELYKFAPWDLPDKSQLHSKDLEWYFFCSRDRKYPNGSRAKRTTENGYWKATGKDKAIIHNSSTIGMRKSLVFHVGKPPKGSRTDWMMYEYRLESKELVDAGFFQDAYVICKIFQKSGSGPKIGEQYGAPFNEEDYDDDTTTEDFFFLCPESLGVQTTSFIPVSEQAMTSTIIETSSDPDLEVDGILLDELLAFLNTSPPREDAHDTISDSAFPDVNANETSWVDPEEIFTELENPYSQELISGNTPSRDHLNETALSSMLQELENEPYGPYLELNDFRFPEDSDPYQSTMLIDASTSMHNNLVPVAEITNEQPPISIQDEDVGRFTYHPDVFESEFLLGGAGASESPFATIESEFLLASFSNPFI